MSKTNESDKPKVILTGPNKEYLKKDQEKADKANKFIGYGRFNSSTDRYMKAFGSYANTSSYTSSDVVFVSMNGGWDDNRVRISTSSLLRQQLEIAIQAGVTFITDDPYHRNRSYNTGERELALYLIRNGYAEVNPGEWKKVVI